MKCGYLGQVSIVEDAGAPRIGFRCSAWLKWIGRPAHHTADIATTTGFLLFRRSVPPTPGKKAAAPVAAAGNHAAAIALKSLGPMSCRVQQGGGGVSADPTGDLSAVNDRRRIHSGQQRGMAASIPRVGVPP